jgi:sulfonate transport system permease protein
VPSLLRFVVGFALAIVGGVSIGLLLGLWAPTRRALMPTVDFVRSIPVTALVSSFIVLLGFGNNMKVAFIAFASFFPILLNTIDGVRGIEPVQRDMARAYKVRATDRIFRIVLPAASPQIFAGLRISLAVALLVMAFSEMVAGTNGIGFFILFSQDTYRIKEMWSGIILLGLIGYAVNYCFVIVERRVLGWHRGWRASTLEGSRA